MVAVEPPLSLRGARGAEHPPAGRCACQEAQSKGCQIYFHLAWVSTRTSNENIFPFRPLSTFPEAREACVVPTAPAVQVAKIFPWRSRRGSSVKISKMLQFPLPASPP